MIVGFGDLEMHERISSLLVGRLIRERRMGRAGECWGDIGVERHGSEGGGSVENRRRSKGSYAGRSSFPKRRTIIGDSGSRRSIRRPSFKLACVHTQGPSQRNGRGSRVTEIWSRRRQRLDGTRSETLASMARSKKMREMVVLVVVRMLSG